MQQTLKDTASCTGIGLHSGAPVEMHVHPGEEDTGIVFFRSDVKNGSRVIAARWNRVVDTRLCTMIGNDYGVTVGTIEHLMAALRGCGVDNAVVELNGPEVPVMDGSSSAFVEMVRDTGLSRQAEPRGIIRILREVTVEEGNKKVTLSPSDEFAFSGEIDFAHPSIGAQAFGTTIVNGNFAHDLADCRTFGFLHEVEYMRSLGLARGGSLENAIVLNDQGVMNPEGLRRSDEFIRHKLLDAVGDLYLAGGPILGAYHGVRAGHALNNAVLHKLFADMNAFEIVRLYDDADAGLRRSAEIVKEAAYAS